MSQLDELVRDLQRSANLATDWRVRREVLRPIARLNTPEALQTILDHLGREPNSSVRIRAVQVLGESADASVVPALVRHYKQEWDSGVRLRVVSAIAALAPPAAARSFLEEASSDRRERVSLHARKLLTELG